MIKLTESLSHWGNTDFEDVFKYEIDGLDVTLLPLQAGLTKSNYVSDSDIKIIVLNISDDNEFINIKSGVFYAGIIAGSCCADDPTPLSEQAEYCEILFAINKRTAETSITLLKN